MNLRRILVAGVISLLGAGQVAAQSTLGAHSSNQGPASLTLHGGWLEPDGVRMAGLRMELEPGWKTYWRIPGDAGIPPHFDWSGSTNVAKVEVEWPAPMVFQTYGIQNVGYKDRLILPFRITPEDPAAPMRLQLSIFYGLCEDVCIPARDDMMINVAPDARKDGAVFIRNALKRVPLRDVGDHVSAAECAITGAGDDRQFTSRVAFTEPVAGTPVVVPEGPENLYFGLIQSRVEGQSVISTGPVRVNAGQWIDRSALSLTVLETGGPALHITGCTVAG
ncbi:MAG: protein-disulfide reductase DsbD domain-containing protein [Pseudomonadota bacterium]